MIVVIALTPGRTDDIGCRWSACGVDIAYQLNCDHMLTATRGDLSGLVCSYVRRGALVVLMTHGTDNSLTRYGPLMPDRVPLLDPQLLARTPGLVTGGRLVLLGCLAGQRLAPALVHAGASMVIAFRERLYLPEARVQRSDILRAAFVSPYVRLINAFSEPLSPQAAVQVFQRRTRQIRRELCARALADRLGLGQASIASLARAFHPDNIRLVTLPTPYTLE